MSTQHDLVTQSVFEFIQRHTDPDDHILEVGAGYGELVQKFLTYNYDIFGIEVSSKKVAVARSNGIELIHSDLESLHYDDQFDVILFIRMLHHGDFRRTLKYAKQLLREDGIIIVEEFGRDRVNKTSLSWLFDLLSIMQTAGIAEFEGNYPGIMSEQEIWDNHFHNPELPTGDEIISTIDEEYEILSRESAPYLYRFIANRLLDKARKDRLVRKIRELEQHHIKADQFDGIAIRVVAKK